MPKPPFSPAGASTQSMQAQPGWLASLTGLLDAGQIDTEPGRLQAHAVDGRMPGAIVYPEDFAQTAAVLHWAQSEKLAVLPWGSGGKIHLGGIPRRVDLVLSTGRLQRVSEYDAANFTLTAQAGVTFAEVAGLAASNLQMLPLQYTFSPMTVGGLIATNTVNPKRLLYGGVRDLLLGLRVALPSGAVVHFGGKVVKNVAGYDMAKFFVGSLGAFGVIVEATFRLFALPERDETLLAVFPTWTQGAGAAGHLLSAQVYPSQVLLFNAAATRTLMPEGEGEASATRITTGGAALLVNVEGMDEAVERQLGEVVQVCQRQGATTLDVMAGEPQNQLRRRLMAVAQVGKMVSAGEGRDEGVVGVRIGTLPSRVPAVMEAVAHTLNAVMPPIIIGDCGVGQVWFAFRKEDLASRVADEPLVQALRDLPRLVAAEGGYVVIEVAPTIVKERLDVWGPPPSAFYLLKALKAKFDPAGILNPGRFIGGL